jgi:hypothetical protein
MKDALVTLTLLLMAAIPASSPAQDRGQRVDLTRDGNTVNVLIGGRPFTTFYFGPEAPKPYLHPLRSAQGTVVTRGFPMRKDIPGESTDHPHHRAMYYAHGDINGIDFWAEGEVTKSQQTAKGVFYPNGELPKGRTVFVKLEGMKSGPEAGTLRAFFHLVGPDGKVMGNEIQAYTFRGDANSRIIDCKFTTQALDKALKMGDTKEGTFAIRVVKALEGPTGHMLNSEGGNGENAIWGKRARWVDYSGTVGDEKLGIAIFDNPQNSKYPTYWHARAYGLFAVNPFGEHDFYNDKTRDGSLTILPGKALTFRYRVLIHHGEATETNIAEAYARYVKDR